MLSFYNNSVGAVVYAAADGFFWCPAEVAFVNGIIDHILYLTIFKQIASLGAYA